MHSHLITSLVIDAYKTGITAQVTISRMQRHNDTRMQEIPYDVPETRPAGTRIVAGEDWVEVEINYRTTRVIAEGLAGHMMKDTTIQLHRSTTIGALHAFVAEEGGPTMQRFATTFAIGRWDLHSAKDLETQMGAEVKRIGVYSHALETYTHLTPAEVVFSSSFNLEDAFVPRPSYFSCGGDAATYSFDVTAMHPNLLSQEDTDDLIHHEISVHLTRPDNSVAWLVSKAFTLDFDIDWAYAGDAHLTTLAPNMEHLGIPGLGVEYKLDHEDGSPEDPTQTTLHLNPQFGGEDWPGDPIEVAPSEIENFLGRLEWV